MNFLVAVLFTCLTLSALAGVETHDLEKKKISLTVPPGWESVKDLFGMPLVLLGPWADEARPAIMVTFTNLTSKEFTPELAQKIFKDYRTEKETWLKGHQGTLKSVLPLTEVKFKDTKGHFVGADFVMSDEEFSERSYYLVCKNEIYNLKWSIRESRRAHLPTLAKIVEEFRCL